MRGISTFMTSIAAALVLFVSVTVGSSVPLAAGHHVGNVTVSLPADGVGDSPLVP